MVSDNDDDWAELARELECDRPSTPEPVPAESADTANPETPEVEAEIVDDVGEPDESPEIEAAESGTTETEPEPSDNPPGTGRKRRRRRRRRRKGGGQPTDSAVDEPATEAETEPNETASESIEADADYTEEVAYDTAGVTSAADAEEDVGGELLRELIANWNVPSWDDVVAGLYRPER